MSSVVFENETIVDIIIDYIGTGYFCNTIITKKFNNCYKNKKICERKKYKRTDFMLEIDYPLRADNQNNKRNSFYLLVKDAISINNIKHFFERFEYDDILEKYGFIYACIVNNIYCLKYMHENGKSKIRSVALSICLQHGSYECLLYCLQHFSFTNYNKHNKNYHLDNGNYVGYHGYDIKEREKRADNKILYDVGEKHYDDMPISEDGLLKCLKYIHKNEIINWDANIVGEAVVYRYDYPILMQYAIENGCDYNLIDNFALKLSKRGLRKCLVLAIEDLQIKYDINKCCNIACEYNRIDILKYFHDVHNYEFTLEQYKTAAYHLEINVLRYLFDVKHINDPEIIVAAAERILNWGHMDCLKFLHEQGVDWDEECTMKAAQTGNIKGLKYAIENGCPYSYRTYQAALCSRNENHYDRTLSVNLYETLKYLDSIDCPKE